MDIHTKRNGLILESDKIVDDLYYFKDILSVGEPRLSRLVIENLLHRLIFPMLLSLLASKDKNVRCFLVLNIDYDIALINLRKLVK